MYSPKWNTTYTTLKQHNTFKNAAYKMKDTPPQSLLEQFNNDIVRVTVLLLKHFLSGLMTLMNL